MVGARSCICYLVQFSLRRYLCYTPASSVKAKRKEKKKTSSAKNPEINRNPTCLWTGTEGRGRQKDYRPIITIRINTHTHTNARTHTGARRTRTHARTHTHTRVRARTHTYTTKNPEINCYPTCLQIGTEGRGGQDYRPDHDQN